jgi:hypothetical protein
LHLSVAAMPHKKYIFAALPQDKNSAKMHLDTSLFFENSDVNFKIFFSIFGVVLQ